LATDSGEQLVGADLLHHLLSLQTVHRSDAERHVAQHLDVNAAQTEHDQRTKLRITVHADDDLPSVGHHLLHLSTPDCGVGYVFPGAGNQRVKGLANLLLVRDAHNDSADI